MAINSLNGSSGGGGSVIKSVQHGSIYMNGAAANASVAISSVDTAKSVVICRGNSVGSAADDGMSFCEVQLTSSTVVEASRGNTGNQYCQVSFTVLEYN